MNSVTSSSERSSKPRIAVFSGATATIANSAPRTPPFLSGNNLTATKARLLLMACLIKFGSPPAAADPDNPTRAELEATMARLDEYQAVFNTH